jgi:hypothetical protein
MSTSPTTLLHLFTGSVKLDMNNGWASLIWAGDSTHPAGEYPIAYHGTSAAAYQLYKHSVGQIWFYGFFSTAPSGATVLNVVTPAW